MYIELKILLCTVQFMYNVYLHFNHRLISFVNYNFELFKVLGESEKEKREKKKPLSSQSVKRIKVM